MEPARHRNRHRPRRRPRQARGTDRPVYRALRDPRGVGHVLRDVLGDLPAGARARHVRNGDLQRHRSPSRHAAGRGSEHPVRRARRRRRGCCARARQDECDHDQQQHGSRRDRARLRALRRLHDRRDDRRPDLLLSRCALRQRARHLDQGRRLHAAPDPGERKGGDRSVRAGGRKRNRRTEDMARLRGARADPQALGRPHRRVRRAPSPRRGAHRSRRARTRRATRRRSTRSRNRRAR